MIIIEKAYYSYSVLRRGSPSQGWLLGLRAPLTEALLGHNMEVYEAYLRLLLWSS